MAAELVDGHRGLRQKTKDIIGNLLHLQSEQKKLGAPSLGISAGPPSKVYAVVRAILQATPLEKTMDLAIMDLENVTNWLLGMRSLIYNCPFSR